MYGMSVKTTVYLPDELKARVEQEALVRGVAEAVVIRDAIEAAVTRPRPKGGIISGPPIVDHIDDYMKGFGER